MYPTQPVLRLPRLLALALDRARLQGLRDRGGQHRGLGPHHAAALAVDRAAQPGRVPALAHVRRIGGDGGGDAGARARPRALRAPRRARVPALVVPLPEPVLAAAVPGEEGALGVPELDIWLHCARVFHVVALCRVLMPGGAVGGPGGGYAPFEPDEGGYVVCDHVCGR